MNRYLNCRHFLAYYLVNKEVLKVKAKYGQFQLCTDCTMYDIYDSHIHCDPKVRLYSQTLVLIMAIITTVFLG